MATVIKFDYAKTLLLVGFLFACMFGYTQSKASAISINEKFLGTWEWNSGNDTFRIVLKKLKFYNKQSSRYIDIIAGWHYYVEKGNLIESSIEFAADTLNAASTLQGFPSSSPNLDISFKDLTRNRIFNAEIELLSGKKDWAIWTMQLKETLRINETRTYPKFQTIPSNIILKRKAF